MEAVDEIQNLSPVHLKKRFQLFLCGRVGCDNLAHRRHCWWRFVANAGALHTRSRFEEAELRDVLIGLKQHGPLLIFHMVESHCAGIMVSDCVPCLEKSGFVCAMFAR